MWVLIDQLSIKITRNCFKWPLPWVLMSNQGPRVIGGSIWTSTDYLCWPRRLGWQGPGQPQTLHSILIITMHHQQIALTKRCPFSETLSEMRNMLSFRLSTSWSTSWLPVKEIIPHGWLLASHNTGD